MKTAKRNAEVQITLNIKMWKFGDITEAEARELAKTQAPVFEKHNLITTVGRNVLARLLAGDTTYSGEINYGALGTSATTPTNADTQLGAEVYRKVYSSQSFDQNIAYIDFFYSATDCNGTYQEFGNFIDGGAGANTGKLFSHILTGGWVKLATESLFISCQYTIN